MGCRLFWLLFLFTLVSLPEVNAAPPDGREVLRRVLANEHHVPFTASQKVNIYSSGIISTTHTREIYLGKNRNRVEFISPARLANRLVINDGKWHLEVNPAQKLVFRTPQNEGATLRKDELLKRIEQSYTVSVDPHPVKLEKRSALILRITPRNNDRDRRVWWVDSATYIVLQRAVYDPENHLNALSNFHNISFKLGGKTAGVLAAPTGKMRVVTRKTWPTFITCEEARRAAPSWAHIPRNLGYGFQFVTAQNVQVNSTSSIHLQYSDGLCSLSLIQMPGQVAVPIHGKSRKVSIFSNTGTLQKMDTFQVLSWSSRNVTSNLIADLNDDMMLRIARIVR